MSWLFGDSLSGNNYEDPLGMAGSKFQRWTDPLSWIGGQKYIDLTSKKIPSLVNEGFSKVITPIDKATSYIDPLYSQTQGIHNWVDHKPASTVGAVVGTVFTGGALGGALGAGAGGGAGGAGAGVGTGVGTEATLGSSGITGGASGLTGFFGGPAAVGDAGLTGTVSAGGSGIPGGVGSLFGSGADMGGALGSAPTGVFSGLLPGGGMTGTTSGALGGGISGGVAGASNIGGASMGGLNLSNLPNSLNQASNQAKKQGANSSNGAHTPGAGGSRAHTPSLTIQQIAAMYGLPAGLLASNQV